jgi:hypothetical protein
MITIPNPFPDTSIADVAARAGVSPEFISLVVVYLAPKLVSPLAAVWKRWMGTTGPDTRTIIKWMTALIVGLGGFLLGLYGYDLRGVLNALVAGVVTYFKTVGDYQRDVNVQAKAIKVSPAAPAVPTDTAATLDDIQREIARQTSNGEAYPDAPQETK